MKQNYGLPPFSDEAVRDAVAVWYDEGHKKDVLTYYDADLL
jgi:hypothetical protein